jgi:hypothetical protein
VAKSKRAPDDPFAFYGAGDATYYEQASLAVTFAKAPSPAQRKQIERGVPDPLGVERWAKRTLLVATDDHAFAGADSFTAFNAAIEAWLVACHAIAPIDFAFRAEDSEAGTTFSEWHRRSLAGAAALLRDLAKRYDDADTRDHVRTSLRAMMTEAGIAIPAKLAPARGWRDALDAGDAATFGPLMARHVEELQLVLDPSNANHRRAVLGSPLRLDEHGRLDKRILAMAIIDNHAAIVDIFVERARKEPFWATSCASTAAEQLQHAPESALALLDRLVELDTAHGVVVENALWAVLELGPMKIARDRLERYWTAAIAKLPTWLELHPYLVKLAPVLGRDVPARPAPPRPKRR